jgi:hypothetical protein
MQVPVTLGGPQRPHDRLEVTALFELYHPLHRVVVLEDAHAAPHALASFGSCFVKRVYGGRRGPRGDFGRSF